MEAAGSSETAYRRIKQDRFVRIALVMLQINLQYVIIKHFFAMFVITVPKKM
jgi:hypothetical protein